MKIKKILSIVLCVIIAAAFWGCADSGMGPGSGYSLSGDSESGDFPQIQAGQLTSAEWNDLKNYDFWKTLFQSGQDSSQGVFSEYLNQWGLETRNLIPVSVTSDGTAVQGAKVQLHTQQDTLLYSAVTDARGNAFLFPSAIHPELSITVQSGEHTKTVEMTYSVGMEAVEIELEGYAARQELIELMLVIDTTGSMGDEISYIKTELIDVVRRAAEFTGAEIKIAILLYRDIGDEYVTRYYPFSSDLEMAQISLNTISAGGGGDFPEAVDVALSEAVSKQWSSGNTTKLILHVLDAPPHDGQQNKTLFHNSIKIASEKGIRLIPVASSGIDKLTEYLLRSEAMMTGGTYTFLTNDSGIGGDHLEPTTQGYVVEYLNAMLLRIIKEYYTGIETAPVPYGQQQ